VPIPKKLGCCLKYVFKKTVANNKLIFYTQWKIENITNIESKIFYYFMNNMGSC